MKKLVIASKNQGKVQEFAKMLQSFPLEVVSLAAFGYLEEPLETGRSFVENACLKAGYYATKTGEMCLADDSGLEVYALSGAPGIRSARYAGEGATDQENNALLLKNMLTETDRKCRFFCALALAEADGGISLTAEGSCEGLLLHHEKGTGGFGYDPLFYSLDLEKTLAEASSEEKNSVSHRSRALRKLVKQMGEKYAHWDNR